MPAPQFTPLVMVADDDPDDQLMIRDAFEECWAECKLCFVHDGVELLTHLKNTGSDAGQRRPDLILLDLNMPRKDGRQTLADIKSSPDFKSIPTVMLTTSQNEDDIASCYDLGANSYIVKPTRYADLLDVAKSLKHYWVNTVELP